MINYILVFFLQNMCKDVSNDAKTKHKTKLGSYRSYFIKHFFFITNHQKKKGSQKIVLNCQRFQKKKLKIQKKNAPFWVKKK